ncbi:Non-specific serine/threonine protein kinase [Bertholletia excelsa]
MDEKNHDCFAEEAEDKEEVTESSDCTLDVRIGDTFKSGQYVVKSELRRGNFATIWLTRDTLNIADGDPEDKKCVVKLLDHFEHPGPNGQHLCMVFDCLGDNLRTLMDSFDGRGLPIQIVKEICFHSLVGLDYLHRQLSIIHTDLKPENIVLLSMIDPTKDPKKSGASLILPNSKNKTIFGSSVTKDVKTSNGDLTKNQKKKIKRKAKKAAQGCVGKEASGETEKEPEASGAAETSDRSNSNPCSMEGKLDGVKGTAQGSQGHKRGSRSTRQKLLASADLKCKLVDFGNACSAHEQFIDDIQSGSYSYMWSFACICFELGTGHVLFDNIDKDEDHLALMMELLGMMPRKIALGGRYSRDFFNRYGKLRHTRRLRFCLLNKILMEKYEFSEQDARRMAGFLAPILDFDPENRPTAAQCLDHPWITSGPHLLEPWVPSIQSQSDTVNSEKRKRPQVRMGNIAIDVDSKQVKDLPSNSKPLRTIIESSSS